MKVVAFNGSPRQNGNTSDAIKLVLGELENSGIKTEIVQVGGILKQGCTACQGCYRSKTHRCAITSDPLNEWIEKITLADGIILGSPVYFNDVTTEMKAFIDRVGYVARANERMYNRKVGAAVVALRRNGAVHALDSMYHFLLNNQMYIVGGSNNVLANKSGEVVKDEEGVRNMQTLGKNMAFLLKTIEG